MSVAGKRKFGVVLAVAVSLMLAGCAPVHPNGEYVPLKLSVEPDPAAVALLPAGVAAAGTLTFATDASYEPNEYKDDDGNPIGWEVDLGRAIAGKLGLTPVIEQASFENIIPSVVGKKYNMGISSFGDTIVREKVVDFVNYFSAGSLWAARPGENVDPNNACGLTVAVFIGGMQALEEVPKKSQACVDAGKPPIDMMKFDSNGLAMSAVAMGKADAVTADSPVTLNSIKKSQGKLVAAGDVFDVSLYGIVLAKDSGLAPAIQAAVQSLMDDGTYLTILEKEGVQAGAISTATTNIASTKG